MAEMLINNRHRHGEKSPNLKGFVSYLDLSQEYPLELALKGGEWPSRTETVGWRFRCDLYHFRTLSVADDEDAVKLWILVVSEAEKIKSILNVCLSNSQTVNRMKNRKFDI